MTAVPRDPMFWKRFSLAVHQQEKPAPSTLKGSSLSSVSEDVEKQEDWLAHKQANWRRQKACVWVSVISMILFVVVLTILLIWLIRHGFFMDGQKVTFP